MRSTYLVSLLCLLATSALGLDFENRATVATYSEYNLARGLGITANSLVLPESDSNSVMTIEKNSYARKLYPLTRQPAEIHAFGPQKFVINDPFDGALSIIDLQKEAITYKHTFEINQGPIYTTVDEGFLYGSDFVMKQISKFDIRRKRVVKVVESGSGPYDIRVLGGKVYVLERGVMIAPDDDYLVVYDKDLNLEKRYRLEGLARMMNVVNQKLCIGYDVPSRIECGVPGEEWQKAVVPFRPDSIISLGEQVAVLTRGGGTEAGLEEDDPETITILDSVLTLAQVAQYDLTEYQDLYNPRFLAFDSYTQSLLIKTDTKLVSVPLSTK